MSPPELTSEQLVTRLSQLAEEHGGGALAFDGDGTLWEGDVGEDVFHAAVTQGKLRAEVLPALTEFGAAYGVSVTGDARAAAATLYTAYLQRHVPEREMCELMSWCYAGWTTSELERFITETLTACNVKGRAIEESNSVLSWARAQGLRCLLISASPNSVVQIAGAQYGFSVTDIAGIRVEIEGGVVQPRTLAPTTYAEGKSVAGKALLGEQPWLAAFGDSVFDLAMMRSAALGVGVRPKANLVVELRSLAGGLTLLPRPQS